ncbi:YdcH family protein [Orrella sp. 11846]|uniref:YdcH family protein n=1 Tax=Orrella sp. 11846 TaxID=3409913 RepID=UPI003B5AFEBC
MFPEYRDLITRLKNKDMRFTRLFEKHHELDHKILNMEDGIIPAAPEEIERLKKEKLLLKDQIWEVLKQHEAQEKGSEA